MTIEAQIKSKILVEALPYIQRWWGKTVVVKVGGEIADTESSLTSFATDLTLLNFVGMRPVVVHGGGNQISKAMVQRGLEPTFVAGYRVTDEPTIAVVKEVMTQVNRQIVGAIGAQGGTAVALAGDDDLLLTARLSGPDGEDLGLVGEVKDVSMGELSKALAGEAIPVIAPLGSGPGGGSYNINADLAAAAVAAAAKAEKLVLLTNTEGLYRDLGDETSLISQTSVPQLRAMLDGGHLSRGMIPKISAVVRALEAGVPRAHILDGRMLHCLLLEIFTDEGIGTMVTPS
ncbi:MAG: acetylglutamate kinase [Actinomycetota bacterium]